MAIPLQSYLWTRVQTAVSAWVESATGLPRNAVAGSAAQVVWTDYDIGEAPKPYVSLQRITMWSEGYPNEYLRERATRVTITVTTNTAGDAVRLWLRFAEVQIIVGAGWSLSDVRDALLAALQDPSQVEPLIFASSGADAIVVTPKTGQIVDVVALLGCTAVADSTTIARVYETSRKYLVRVQLYSDDGDGDVSIDEYADAMLMSLRTSKALALLQYGVSVQGVPETATDASAISGANRERRLFFDVTFAAISVAYESDAASIDEITPPEFVGLDQAS